MRESRTLSSVAGGSGDVSYQTEPWPVTLAKRSFQWTLGFLNASTEINDADFQTISL